jgi:predicted CoA-substrate-specific enzyme activase
MYSLGIDVGYSSVKVVVLNECNDIEYQNYILHKGHIRTCLRQEVARLGESIDTRKIVCGALTGSGCKVLAEQSGAAFVNEVACLVEGCLQGESRVCSIIEIGGQNAKFITDFDAADKGRIKISMNPNCSAGTGSFLEEQVSRLNLNIEEYSDYAARATSRPRIAGRCSVFAKTDITHHQQEGVSVEDILLGLAYSVVKNYRSAVMRGLPRNKPMMFVGGVAHNKAIVAALRDVLKLGSDELLVPDHFSCVGAVGAAVIARREGYRVDIALVENNIDQARDVHEQEEARLPRLFSYGNGDGLDKHDCGPVSHGQLSRCYLGVDVGSTSTNLVLMDEERNILGFTYLRTLGRPLHAVSLGLRQLREEFGDDMGIVGVCTTGSGRYMIGRRIGADVVRDEITAQAKAAVVLDPTVDTIFEIGGQDSKFISLRDGVVVDFQMNKICAAGTGSFLEEQAKKLNVPIDEFGPMALGSPNPINLGERCTVFIESSVAAHLAQGAPVDDLVSGLCYSIVKNYLNRVVGHKAVGDNIFFQGGVAYNQGVVNAFRQLTGKNVRVPKFFSVTGAYGAALLAAEAVQNGVITRSAFKGFDVRLDDVGEEVSREQGPASTQSAGKETFDARLARLSFGKYDGIMDPSRKTVGMPRALFIYSMYPIFREFFDELGFNVLLSDATNEETISLCQEYSLDETCYPVKLINGHVAELVRKNVDYIFFPDVFTVMHPGSEARRDFGCAYMQLAFKLVKQAMDLEEKGIELLSPTIAFSLGQAFMQKGFLELGAKLGKSPEQTGKALQRGMKAFHEFEAKMERNAREVAASLDPNKKAFVLISKLYGVSDPVLNMGIPTKLNEMGYQVLPFCDLPEVNPFGQHPNMYWPFGQHILETGMLVKEHPNLYAILLTHHGCGPDTLFTHYFKEIMDGKPYLNIEVDEHSSGVGVITRVEAFINSLAGREDIPAEPLQSYCDQLNARRDKVEVHTGLGGLGQDTSIILPALFPYADIAAAMLQSRGFEAHVLASSNRDSLERGRRHTITNEYFSMTTLLGDVLRHVHGLEENPANTAVVVPQTEGAEVDGQYARFLRTKLDEEGFANVGVVAPYLEDLFFQQERDVEAMFVCLLAGDVIMAAPRTGRGRLLQEVVEQVRSGKLDMDAVVSLARKVGAELVAGGFAKRVFAIGEPLVVFNDFLNTHTFGRIEEAGHRVAYAPLSEFFWLFWRDYVDQNVKEEGQPAARARLDHFRKAIESVADGLGEESHFVPDQEELVRKADASVGYYAGSFGRYREARLLVGGNGNTSHVDGVINATSMYENTGITLNVLHKGFENGDAVPVLNLTFDGSRNENDETKVESFLYYI